MKTILVPLDGSALVEQFPPNVRLLATMLKANMHLLRVSWMSSSFTTATDKNRIAQRYCLLAQRAFGSSGP
jgi:hypothetical protein